MKYLFSTTCVFDERRKAKSTYNRVEESYKYVIDGFEHAKKMAKRLAIRYRAIEPLEACIRVSCLDDGKVTLSWCIVSTGKGCKETGSKL